MWSYLQELQLTDFLHSQRHLHGSIVALDYICFPWIYIYTPRFMQKKIIVSYDLDINIYVCIYILTFNLDTLTFLTLFQTHNREYGPLIVFQLPILLLILTTNEWSKWIWSLLEYFFIRVYLNNCLSNPTLLIFSRYTFYNLSQSNNVIIFLTI